MSPHNPGRLQHYNNETNGHSSNVSTSYNHSFPAAYHASGAGLGNVCEMPCFAGGAHIGLGSQSTLPSGHPWLQQQHQQYQLGNQLRGPQQQFRFDHQSPYHDDVYEQNVPSQTALGVIPASNRPFCNVSRSRKRPYAAPSQSGSRNWNSRSVPRTGSSYESNKNQPHCQRQWFQESKHLLSKDKSVTVNCEAKGDQVVTRSPNDLSGNEPGPKRHNMMQKSSAEIEAARDELRKLGVKMPGESPEEVSRWVAARLAKWPTRANIEKKKQEDLARKERGQLASKKPLPSLKDSVRQKREDAKGVSHHCVSSSRGTNRTYECKESTSQADKTEQTGTLELKRALGALGSLAVQYADDSCEEEISGTKPSTIGPSKTCDSPSSRQNAKNRTRLQRNRRKRTNGVTKNASQNQMRRGCNTVEEYQPKRHSLLRKLLEPTIRTEQNLLLQCFRILVRENFLAGTPKF